MGTRLFNTCEHQPRVGADCRANCAASPEARPNTLPEHRREATCRIPPPGGAGAIDLTGRWNARRARAPPGSSTGCSGLDKCAPHSLHSMRESRSASHRGVRDRWRRRLHGYGNCAAMSSVRFARPKRLPGSRLADCVGSRTPARWNEPPSNHTLRGDDHEAECLRVVAKDTVEHPSGCANQNHGGEHERQ